MAKIPKNIDDYISGFDPTVQKTLNDLRSLIKSEVPEAAEKISYGLPTFYLDGNLIHFAAFKNHYSIFPAPRETVAFENELAPYRSGKGTLRFTFDEEIPWSLVKKVVRFRVKEKQQARRKGRQ